MPKNLKIRFWEIDLLRGIAIVMMIVFHFLYDLNYFGKHNINLDYGFWSYFGRATAIVFLVLVGISLTLSFSRTRITKKTQKGLFIKYIRRGFTIFSWGMLITLITWIFFRQEVVVFGILHFIGISIILAYAFLRLGLWNLFIGVFLIFLGMLLKNFTFSSYWLVWLGLRPNGFYTFDYFPLLPWFGVVLIGIFLGNLLYRDYKRRFIIPNLSGFSITKVFCFLGRHSLLIYLLHQPILIAVMYGVGWVG